MYGAASNDVGDSRIDESAEVAKVEPLYCAAGQPEWIPRGQWVYQAAPTGGMPRLSFAIFRKLWSAMGAVA